MGKNYYENVFRVVLYHGGCFDGVGAAWAYKEFLVKQGWSAGPVTLGEDGVYRLPMDEKEVGGGIVEFHGMGHKDPVIPASCVDARVLMVDYCFKQPLMNELLEKAKWVVVLDHHITTQGIVIPEDKGKLCLDMNRSGATLTWDLFLGEQCKRPHVIDYIGDRDLWRFVLPDSKEINGYIYSQEATFATMDRLSKSWYGDMFKAVGEELMRARMKDCVGIAKGFRLYKMNVSVENEEKMLVPKQYTVAAGDCMWLFRSDAGDYINGIFDIDFALLYTWYQDSSSFSLSFRGRNKVDCSKIASTFGGGGHPNAAACNVPNLNFLTLLSSEEAKPLLIKNQAKKMDE